jgi:CRISPR-associated protein Cas2
MLVFVAYDISENKSRNNLIKRLRHFGLHRIQKSLFAGNLSLDDRFDLNEDIDMYLSSEKDSIIITPVCESCKDSITQFSDMPISLPEKEDFKFI